MNKYLFYCILCFGCIMVFGCQPKEEEKITQTEKSEFSPPIWTLDWSEEFNYTGLPDSTIWSYDKGDGCPNVCGWGNNELQYYTVASKNNVWVENGFLTLTAIKEEIGGKSYSSARMVSKKKKDFRYGKFEIRAKLPTGLGTWPAIWMLPTDWEYGGWPKSGEIDIMEHVGYEPDSIYGTVHTKAFNHTIGTQKGKAIYKPKAESSFHNYGLEWDESKIKFLVDDEVYNVFENTKGDYKEWPFDKAFHMILNIAVGGNWGGSKGVDENIWPQKMEVDYIRYYKPKKQG